jgi:hypothetical protein
MIAPVTALADYFTSYSYTPNEGSWAIGGIVKFENEVTGGGASWPDAYDGCEPSSGCLTQTINQVFNLINGVCIHLFHRVHTLDVQRWLIGVVGIGGDAQFHVRIKFSSCHACLL